MKSKLHPLTIMAFIGLLIIGLSACNSDSAAELPTPETRNIWTGGTLTFEKGTDVDPSQAVNQDRITDNVWLTRGNDGGQIYNAKTENEFNKANSPAGTQWAIGSIDNIDNLSFKSFRDAVDSPKNVVGKDLVLFLPADDVFLSVKFTKWSSGKDGSFAYERSTE